VTRIRSVDNNRNNSLHIYIIIILCLFLISLVLKNVSLNGARGGYILYMKVSPRAIPIPVPFHHVRSRGSEAALFAYDRAQITTDEGRYSAIQFYSILAYTVYNARSALSGHGEGGA